MVPLHVYLDLNKWVDLAKAARGRSDGARFRDVLDIVRYGKKVGLVVFPLSSTHYMEFLRVRSGRRRQAVAPLMIELSGLTTMLSLPETLPAEIDRAVRKRCGHPLNVREKPIFGHGIGHAFGREPVAYKLPEHVTADDETRRRVEHMFTEVLERRLLEGPADDEPLAGDPRAVDAVQDKHAEEERELGAAIRRSGRRAGDFRHVWLARALFELVPAINDSMLRAGLDPSLFLSLGRHEMEAFLLDLPTSHALFEIRCRRHRDPKLPWTRRDLNDLYGLSAAVVFCDVVVTERHMAALIREAKLDEHYQTTILTDLADLSGVLVAPASCHD